MTQSDQPAPRIDIAPGIYFGLDEKLYHRARGLSNSRMKDLEVSDLNYWYRNLNPAYTQEEETEPQRFGSAVHCRLLEPQNFSLRYTEKPTAEDIPGCLDTVDDIKKWLAEVGLPVSAKKKQDVINRVLESGLDHPPIWDIEETRLAEINAGKTFLKKFEMNKLAAMEAAVSADPYAKAILTGGIPEVSFFVNDPETGILLKARLDYVRTDATIDVKSFSNSRGKSVVKAVNDAIFYEGYYRCAAFYQYVRELCRQLVVSGDMKVHGEVDQNWRNAFLENSQPGFGLMFIESDAPFHIDLVGLSRREAAGGDQNVYWTTAENWMREKIYHVAQAQKKYGDGIWRQSEPPRALSDLDLPQLIFS
jgi:PDDEXK-like domain of unknown function (DUF3799)